MTSIPPDQQYLDEQLAHELHERVKELQCLYRVSEILSAEGESVNQKLQAVAESLPAGWQHASIAAARIRVDNRHFQSNGWKKAQHRQSAEIRVAGDGAGEVELVYTGHPPADTGTVFLREEELLIREIARRIGEFLRSEWRRQRADFLEEHLGPEQSDRDPVSAARGGHGLIGDSEAMQAVHRAIAKASRSNATVLICGESGTGKELVARAVHYGSDRAGAPFVPVNCAAIPESLIESELFGYVKGAFTGANTTRAGFFQTAEGGTIFLDEVSEMNAAAQAKLLRVLQDHEVRMVGSDRTRKADVRILAATNKDLATLVESGRFRADLFFRLNVLTIALPSLRERGQDLALLIDHFVDKWRDAGGDRLAFSDRAMRALESYGWPGNVRELENMIQRLSVMAEDRYVDIGDLPGPMHFAPARKEGSLRTLQAVEAEHIRQVLEAVEGNRSRAARILGIDRKTLRKKLEELGGP